MTRATLLGLLAGLVASTIWGGHAVLARVAVAPGAEGQGLLPLDLLFSRYAPSALLLAPLAWRHRATLAALGARRMVLLAMTGGAPNLALFVIALQWAPASHGGTIAPMTVPVAGALLAIPLLREWPSRGRTAALGAMAAGVALIGWDGLAGPYPDAWRGDLLLLGAGFTWAIYSLLLRRWRVPAVPATAIIALVSAALIVPLWVVVRGGAVAELPAVPMLMQLVGQGVVIGVGAMFLFGRSIELLGATRGASLSVMVPVSALLLSAWLLGEPLSMLKVTGAGLAVAGMLAAVLFTGRRAP